jgi:anaerobic selenocysteine-containing dehydrogenase
VHPIDAAAAGIDDGELASVCSASGAITVPVEITDRVAPGVCSLPHGWGHDAPGVGTRVARQHAGVNSNVLSSPEIDPLSGTAVLNGIAVRLSAARPKTGAVAP